MKQAGSARVLAGLVVAAFTAAGVAGCGGGGGSSGGGFVANTAATPDAGKSTVTASPSRTSADGTSAITFTVTVRDANSNALANVLVTPSATGTNNSFNVPGLTNSSGVVLVTLTSTKGQTETVSFKAVTSAVPNGVTITQTVSVTFDPIPSVNMTSSIAASPSSVTADGSTSSAVTVTVKDAFGAAVPGANVTFSTTGTNVSLSPTTPQATNSGGNATVNVSSTKAQTATITASVSFVGSASGTAITLSTPVTFVAGTPTAMVFANSGATVTAGDPFTLVVNIVDANGNVCPVNKEVALCLPNEFGQNNAATSRTADSLPTGLVARRGLSRVFAFQSGSNGSNTIVVANNGVASFAGLVQTLAGQYNVGAVATGLPAITGTYTCVANVAAGVSFLSSPLGFPGTNTNDPSAINSNATYGYTLFVYSVDGFGNPTTRFRDTGTHPIQLQGLNGLALTGNGTTGNGSVNLDANGRAAFPGIGTTTGGSTATNYRIQPVDLANGMNGTSAFTLVSNNSDFFKVVNAGEPVAILLSNVPSTFTAGTPSTMITASLVDSAGNPAMSPFLTNFRFGLVNDEDFATGTNLNFPGVNIPANTSSVTFSVTMTNFPRMGGSSFTVFTGFTQSAPNTANQVFMRNQFLANQVTINTGAVTQLQLTQNAFTGYGPGELPPNLGVGQTVAPSVEVSALDASGNLVTSFNGAVTLALTNATGTGTFNGGGQSTLTANASGGKATFSFTINGGATPAGMYTIDASTTNPAIANVTNPFTLNVVAGTNGAQTTNPAKLVFLTQPTNTISGSGILSSSAANNEIQVQIQDAFGVPIKVAGVQIDIGGVGNNNNAPGSAIGTFDQGNGQAASGTGIDESDQLSTQSANTDANGIARFQGLTENFSCVNLRLLATSNGLNSAYSAPFDIFPGAPNNYNVQADVQFGVVFRAADFLSVNLGSGGPPTVRIIDNNGNTATTHNGVAIISLVTPIPMNGGALTGTFTQPYVSGIAIFPDLKIVGQAAGTTVTYNGLRYDFPTVAGQSATGNSFMVQQP